MTASRSYVLWVLIVVLLPAVPATATEQQSRPSNPTSPSETRKQQFDVSIVSGARIATGVMWGFIPFPATAAVSVDIGRLRLRADGGYHLAGVGYGIISGGLVLTPVGKEAAQRGGFQLKLPILLDVGYMGGRPEAHDGYNEDIGWLLVGPSSGVDLTWWKANRLGFTISIKVGAQGTINVNSNYVDGYSRHEDNIINIDGAILFGVVL